MSHRIMRGARNLTSTEWAQYLPSGHLPERKDLCLRAGLEERDLQRALADRVVLAHELVQAAVAEHAVPVVGDVHAV
jgi:hypothetical protein